MFDFGSARFRAIEKEDLKYIHEWENDYELFLYTRANPLHFITVEQVENEYEELLKNKNALSLIVEDSHDKHIIGLARFMINESDVRSAEIGIYIAAKEQWNKGLGKLITLGLLEMLFYHRGFEKVVAGSAEFNSRAHKALEYCGFRKEGEIRRGIKLYGKYYSWCIYGELYEEYMQIREKALKETLKEDYEEYIKMVSNIG
ncbi:MAG: GNAT family N-acetyltransferase [Thermoplasmata archaeon]